jgi:hypothetical protein
MKSVFGLDYQHCHCVKHVTHTDAAKDDIANQHVIQHGQAPNFATFLSHLIVAVNEAPIWY